MVELDEIRFNLSEMIERILSIFSISAAEKGLNLKKEVHSYVPDFFLGDPVRLRQVLINLMGNAIKFTQSGEITISVKCQKPPGCSETCSLIFSVSDTGIGIAKEKLQTIFESFSQADSSTTRIYGGTGLGLSISKKLVKLMGGKLKVKSKEGKGSKFHFTLKMKIELNDEELHEQPERPLMEGVEKPLKILLAEDVKDNRKLIEAYLKDTIHSLISVENGEEALKNFTECGDYDLVLMDMQMPVMDGYTAVKLIREWETNNGKNETPVLAFTAHALKEEVDKCLEAGCTSLLAKPLKKTELIKKIRSYSME